MWSPPCPRSWCTHAPLAGARREQTPSTGQPVAWGLGRASAWGGSGHRESRPADRLRAIPPLFPPRPGSVIVASFASSSELDVHRARGQNCFSSCQLSMTRSLMRRFGQGSGCQARTWGPSRGVGARPGLGAWRTDPAHGGREMAGRASPPASRGAMGRGFLFLISCGSFHKPSLLSWRSPLILVEVARCKAEPCIHGPVPSPCAQVPANVPRARAGRVVLPPVPAHSGC